MRNRVTKANGQSRSMYRALGRDDLVTFDREAKDMILGAIAAGCLGRISAKGHCILRNSAGGTASVPRNMTSPNRSAQNARADIKRLMREHAEASGPRPEDQDRPIAPPRSVSVTRAFVEHGAAFSRWFDAQPSGLPADAIVQVRFDAAGIPAFSVEHPGHQERQAEHAQPQEEAAAEQPPHQEHQEPQQSENPDMQHHPTRPENAPEPTEQSRADDAESVLARVRAALGEDPRIGQLESRVFELEELLRAEQERSSQTEARLSLVQEAMRA